MVSGLWKSKVERKVLCSYNYIKLEGYTREEYMIGFFLLIKTESIEMIYV
jgi:hypothetical protein